MGVLVVAGRALRVDYSRFAWPARAVINTGYIGLSFLLVYALKP